MKLPNGARARVAPLRITGYLLNPQHPTGKHKARVFAAALGLDLSGASEFHNWLAALAVEGEAQATNADAHGQRFVISGKFLYKGVRRRSGRPGSCALTSRTLNF